MTIYEIRLANTRRLILERRMKLKDLADLMNKSPAQISSFAGANPQKKIGDQIARELEIALDLPRGYLDTPKSLTGDAAVVGPVGRKLPVIGSVAAGSWCEAVDLFHPGDADEWIDAPGPVGPNAFILRIDGFSMHPKFIEGDKVVIDPDLDSQPGHFVVAKRTQDKGVTFKQLRKEGDEFFLFALNPDWPERVIRLTEEWHICGRARWKITDL